MCADKNLLIEFSCNHIQYVSVHYMGQ